jgi:hypothetical protein
MPSHMTMRTAMLDTQPKREEKKKLLDIPKGAATYFSL